MRKIIFGLTLMMCSVGSFACDIYIRSLPYEITESRKDYCVTGPGGNTLYFDAATAPLLNETVWAGISHTGKSIFAHVRPAIHIRAKDITLTFLSKVENTNPLKAYDEIDVGIYAAYAYRVENAELYDVALKNFSIGIDFIGVDRVKMANAVIEDSHFKGISIQLVDELTILATRVDGLSTDMSYPNANLLGMQLTPNPNGVVSLRGANVDRFYNLSTSRNAYNYGIDVSGDRDSDIDLFASAASNTGYQHAPNVNSTPVIIGCTEGCSISVSKGQFNENNSVITQRSSAIHLWGGISSFELTENRFRHWDEAIYVEEGDPDTLGYFAKNTAYVYKDKNGQYPSYDEVYNVGSGAIDGGNNKIIKR